MLAAITYPVHAWKGTVDIFQAFSVDSVSQIGAVRHWRTTSRDCSLLKRAGSLKAKRQSLIEHDRCLCQNNIAAQHL